MTTQTLIPSYLYTQYQDDDDLQAFISAFNQTGQAYIDAFNALELPIYTGTNKTAEFLDWVATGVYGLQRPSLPSGAEDFIGEFNTAKFDILELNEYRDDGLKISYPVTDDIYKRIITWHFYKGDESQFTIEWFKRRITRFLIGVDGVGYPIDNTYAISLTFTGHQVNIQISNNFGPYIVSLSDVQVFKSAIESGVLETPFQYTYVVTYSGF